MVVRGRGGALELRTESLPEVPEQLQPLLGEDKPTEAASVPVEVGKS